MATDINAITTSCGFGSVRRQPFVNIFVNDKRDRIFGICQVSPAQARAIALTILASADAAESDAAIFEVMRDDDLASELVGTLRLVRSGTPLADLEGTA